MTCFPAWMRSLVLSVLAGICVCAAAVAADSDRPNVVVIVSDDHGFGDIGWNNREVNSPRLDQMAREGVRLDRFYVNPICSVTRAALMTGIATRRTGVNNSSGLDLKYRLLPQAFQAAGYQTWMMGKWHLGGPDDSERKGIEYYPQKRGFDYFYGHLHGAIDYFSHRRKDLDALDWQRNGEPVVEEGFSTDLLAADAVRKIQARDRGRPFLLYVAFNAVHGPLQPPPDSSGLSKRDRRPILLANLTRLDGAIGRILDGLKAESIDRQTLVLFFGDNGGQRNQGANNGDLRGEKGGVYEGGIRVPAAMRWPGVLKPAVSAQFLNVADIYPTLCAAAGIECVQTEPLDGVNLWSALRSGQVAPRPPFVMGTREVACFSPPWKLVVGERGESIELFDVVADPGEQTNRASENAGVAESLSKWLATQPAADKRGGKKGKGKRS